MDGDKIKILLVEDDALNYNRVKDFLEAEGYEVLEHPEIPIIDNYEDAIALCRQHTPHIAILDIIIKGKKDGLEIGQYIIERYHSPVIFLSSYNTDENLRRSGLMGADGFVVKIGKPYELRQLKADIQRLIPLAQEADRERKEGAWFHLRDINTNAGFYRIRVRWEDIRTVTTKNAPKNSVIIQTTHGKQYNYHKSLTDFHEELPGFIVRYSNTDSVNACLFNKKGKSEWVYYIDDNRYEIAEAFRNDRILAILRKLHP